jgi:predicted DNA-binding transcriptional regulator YafY
MTDTLYRQWAMLQYLPPAPRKISTAALQRRLEDDGFPIDIRSLQRDLLSLSRIFPLICDQRSKPFGWSWRKDSRALSIPGMSPSTALTLKLAKTLLEPLLPRSVLSELQGQMDSADRALQGLSSSALRDWPKKVRIIPAGLAKLPPRIDGETFYVAQKALLTSTRFKARYLPRERAGREPKEYEVSPLGLVMRASVAYLVCTLWDYPDIKQLALHRLSRAVLLDTPVKAPAGFDLDAYIASQEFDFPSGKMIRLKVALGAAAAFHLRETPLSLDQRMEDLSGDRVRLSATVMDTAQLRWWLQGFGSDLEVLAPKPLRDEFRKTAVELSRLYSKRGR